VGRADTEYRRGDDLPNCHDIIDEENVVLVVAVGGFFETDEVGVRHGVSLTIFGGVDGRGVGDVYELEESVHVVLRIGHVGGAGREQTKGSAPGSNSVSPLARLGLRQLCS
jgi:hypothetical protein